MQKKELEETKDFLKNIKIIIDPVKDKNKESKYYDTKLVDAGTCAGVSCVGIV